MRAVGELGSRRSVSEHLPDGGGNEEILSVGI